MLYPLSYGRLSEVYRQRYYSGSAPSLTLVMAALALVPLVVISWATTGAVRQHLSPPVLMLLFGALAYGVDRLLSAAEQRGWVHYRKKRGGDGGVGVTTEWLHRYDPSRKHMQQVSEVQEWKRDEDDEGDGASGGWKPGRSKRAGGS